MAKRVARRGSRLQEGAEPELVRWLEDMQAQRRSPYTVKHYGLCVRLFQDWLRQELKVRAPLAKVGPSDLKQYQLWLSTQKGYAKTTLYVTIKALQSFYRFLGSTAADDLKAPRRGQALPKYLTEAEGKRLLEATGGNTRAQAIVSLLLYTGMRVGELTRILAPDLDIHEGLLRVRSGKGDKDRLVIVPPRAMEPLLAWLKERPPSATDYVFAGRGDRPVTSMTVQRVVLRAAKGAGLQKRVTPHVLRHTLATTLLRRGGDIRFIQKILGHASIATTQIYTHLDDGELRRMYQRSQPEF